jgi:hypothetical protein
MFSGDVCVVENDDSDCSFSQCCLYELHVQTLNLRAIQNYHHYLHFHLDKQKFRNLLEVTQVGSGRTGQVTFSHHTEQPEVNE